MKKNNQKNSKPSGSNFNDTSDFSCVQFVPQTEQYYAKLKLQVNNLKTLLYQWSLKSGKINHYGIKENEIFKKYITYHHEYYEYDQFDSETQLLQLNNSQINLNLIQSEQILYKSFNLFPKAKWPIRFDSKFVARIKEYSLSQIYYVLGFVYFLADGNFHEKSRLPYGYFRPLVTKNMNFNRFLVVKLFKQKNLFAHIGVQKIPVVKQGVIKRYQYVNYMNFLDILGDMYVENKNKLDQRMKVFIDKIENDVARRDHYQQLKVDQNLYSKNNQYFFSQYYNDYTERLEYFNANINSNSIVVPLFFQNNYISASEGNSMIFDKQSKRWISQDHLNYVQRKKIAQYQKQINDSMIGRFVDFQSAQTLVQLLTKIPNFKVNLTQQEKSVIGQNGNVLAIGRSGTGKTTCAVLRLFSIEMLFRIRVSLYKKKFSETVKDVHCGSEDIDEALGLHCIFLTASPVLTHEIQRYYKKLTDNIKAQLQKKKKKVEEEKKKLRQIQKMKQQIIEQKSQVSFEDLNQSSKIEQQKKQVLKQESGNQGQEIIPQALKQKKSAQQIQEEKQLNEEFKDIKLQQDINNQNFDEKQEDIDEIKQKFEQNIKRFNSLFDLTEKDYPGFFTVKSFIMMIDGVMSKPFFIRNKNVIINQDSKASWHNENKGVMMIEDYYRNPDEEKLDMEDIQQEINYSDQEQLQHEYLRQIQLRENKDKQNLTKKLNKNKNILSFEVDYEYFLVHFWPRVVKKYYSSRNITPHLVWTEIYSTIKGSASAHQYPGQYLSQHAYITASANTFLTHPQKLDIYETFCQYQRWKIRAGGYDLMDTVNYILNRIRFAGYEGPQIHYVMIDEVQDLPHAIVYLLSKVASCGVFYSGDTAQTIAKGVGFRFCDLKTLFNSNVFDSSLTLKAPVIKHLTVNFRSHNNILQLANSIVSSIEILFPKTIDRMKKQISDLPGPKPMILSTSDEQLLFYVLCGGQDKNTQQSHNAIKKSPLQFGCDQVIIVRDQQSKQRVPAMLQHALCLTIYQAKGLQFNDVILFNFFAQSPCQDKWSALKTLQVITQQIQKDQYQSSISRHKSQSKEQKANEDNNQQIEQVAVQQTFNKQKNAYEVKKLAQKKKTGFINDINDYAELCSQLKLLYTAITRPRKTLIIYDDKQSHSRLTLQRIWQKLDVVESITKELVISASKKTTQTEEVKIFQKIVASTDCQSWKQQGLKMYTRGYFDQAMKCFQRSGHKQLYKKAEANKNADEATKKLIQIQSQRNAIKKKFNSYQSMGSSELSKIKNKLKMQQARSTKQFLMAAQIFEDMMMFKQAGQCYFSGKKFQSAFECFCKAFMNKQAAQSLEMQNKFREAAQYYEKDQSYLKVIECLDLVNQWTLILQKIHKFAHKMSQYEKQALLKKYSALALQQLVYEIEFENQQEQKKPENNRVQVIQEKQSDQQEYWDSDQDPELAAEREYQRKLSEGENSNPSRKASEMPVDNMVEVKQSIYQALSKQNESKVQSQNGTKQEKKIEQEESFSELNQSKQTEKVQKSVGLKSVQKSFADLNNSSQVQIINQSQKVDIISLQSSFGDLNQLQPDLQSIKSLVDPEDLWVRNSISQIGHKLHSEYSVIDEQENYNLNAKIIKTKGNIFVQDDIMRKIVNIVSIINSSVSEFFQQFKGYQSLITLNKKQQTEQNNFDNRPEISQFEDIDPKFINIILDTLQSFKLFKLCLFVCNRYHLPAKAGRYLLSLGLKYSTNCISNNFINPILLAPSNFRKIEVQKGILASIALHAIYENVNPDFLKIKVTQNEQTSKNSLGIYFIQGLILQGLYKKAVFMVNPKESFKILSNYNDFQAYSSLYHQKIIKKQQVKGQIQLPSNVPKNQDETNYTSMLLKKILFEVNVVYRFQSVSLRYYKEFAQTEPSYEKLQKYKIPNYLPFTKILIENKSQLVKQFKKLIVNAYSILQKGSSLQILDLVGALTIITHKEEYHEQIVKQFSVEEFLQFYRCSNHIQIALKKYTGANALNIIEAVFFMHQCYRINYCKSMNFINDIYCFVHRTSTVANELVENQKIHTSHFAYFFQQDYNLILAKSSKLSSIILKKYELALVKLYTKKKSQKIQKAVFLPEDFREYQEQQVLKKALVVIIDSMNLSKKDKKTVNKSMQISKKKLLKSSYDFKFNGGKDNYIVDLHPQSQSSEQEAELNEEFRFYRPNFNTKLTYLAPALIEIFSEHSKNAKQIIQGHEFYCAGLNNLYREYTSKKGGYNLFDAVEFKKFNRIDLYAQNILSVIDGLSLFARHNYIAQNLILLMLQYRSLEEPKGFSLQVTNNELKYFQNLELKSLKNNNEIDPNLIRQQINALLFNKDECIFVHQNKLISEMDCQEIAKLICDYLQILKEEYYSKYVNFGTIILSLLINLSSNEDINNSLRKIINTFARQWKLTSLYYLTECKGLGEYSSKRKTLLSSTPKMIQQKLHRIEIKNIGNLKKSIDESEFDYEVQGRIIEAKKKAAKKIASWWRSKRNELKQKKRQGSYFQLAVQPERLTYARKKDTIKDIRLMRLLHTDRNIYTELNFLLQTEDSKDELLSFLLTNTINSSLDFHFVLLSLNKIQQCRHKYFEYCAWDSEQIHEFSIQDVKEEINEMQKTIQIWKKDQKWLRDKNINLKKKKVFEVKWMTKNLGLSGLLKKRAGLKKQELLQIKKKFLKHTK